MPIIDTAYRCIYCEQEYATRAVAEACEVRDRWRKLLEDHAAQMHGLLTRVFDVGGVTLDLAADIADLFEVLGPAPPARTT
jgi:hypothetical protein